MRIAQISDLHFGKEIPAIVEALLADLHAWQPTLVAVCGDLTQNARDKELAAARAFVSALPDPALVVPGNHDMPSWPFLERFLAPWRRWERYFADPKEPRIVLRDGVLAVGVSTPRRWGGLWDWSRGRINEEQMTHIADALERASDDVLRVVVAHHPFLLTEANAGRGTVGRAAMALERLSQKADLMLGGHVHHGYSGATNGFVVAQSGTAFSSRLKGEPNGYNRIEGTRDALHVDVMRWDGSAFVPHRRDHYRREGDVWVAVV